MIFNQSTKEWISMKQQLQSKKSGSLTTFDLVWFPILRLTFGWTIKSLFFCIKKILSWIWNKPQRKKKKKSLKKKPHLSARHAPSKFEIRSTAYWTFIKFFKRKVDFPSNHIVKIFEIKSKKFRLAQMIGVQKQVCKQSCDMIDTTLSHVDLCF